MANQSLTGVFLGAEIGTERAQQMIAGPRRRRRRRPAAGGGRPDLSRSRSGRGARVPREPPGRRPGGAGPMRQRGGTVDGPRRRAERSSRCTTATRRCCCRTRGTSARRRSSRPSASPALATTSAGFAGTLGRLDGGVTRDEVLEHAARDRAPRPNCRCSADLENCFADDPEGVAETIALAIETGLVGGSVEDFTGRNDEDLRRGARGRAGGRGRRGGAPGAGAPSDPARSARRTVCTGSRREVVRWRSASSWSSTGSARPTTTR